MIWWRGRGLWIGLFACVPAVAASKLGATHLAMAYAASAVLVYLFREWLGWDSALFSIPTKFWPPLLLLVALVVQFTSPRQGAEPTGNKPQKVIAELKASLPRMLNGQIRMDRAHYDNDLLRYDATSLVSFDAAGVQQAAFERQVRQHYCEQLKALWQADIGIAFKLTVPPRSLSERVGTYSFALQPKACQPGSR